MYKYQILDILNVLYMNCRVWGDMQDGFLQIPKYSSTFIFLSLSAGDCGCTGRTV
jgi:hypothetical protein